MTTSIIIAALGALATIVLAVYAVYSAREARNEAQRNHRLTSVNIAAQALKEFAADQDMQKVFYLIEYKKFEYERETFHQSEMERPTDKLLRHFAAVALAWKSKLVEEAALRLVRYYVLRILDDKHIQAYMKKVCGDTEKDIPHIGEHPYHVLAEWGEKLRQSTPKKMFSVRHWNFQPGRR